MSTELPEGQIIWTAELLDVIAKNKYSPEEGKVVQQFSFTRDKLIEFANRMYSRGYCDGYDDCLQHFTGCE